jgi:hypothetical protein
LHTLVGRHDDVISGPLRRCDQFAIVKSLPANILNMGDVVAGDKPLESTIDVVVEEDALNGQL